MNEEQHHWMMIGIVTVVTLVAVLSFVVLVSNKGVAPSGQAYVVSDSSLSGKDIVCCCEDSCFQLYSESSAQNSCAAFCNQGIII